MSDISMCPMCGEEPNILFDLFDTHEKYPKGYFCCEVECRTLTTWNQYAAAMEFARATRTLEDAMEPLNSGKLKMGEALPTIKLAMADQKACEQRVLEVFGK